MIRVHSRRIPTSLARIASASVTGRILSISAIREALVVVNQEIIRAPHTWTRGSTREIRLHCGIPATFARIAPNIVAGRSRSAIAIRETLVVEHEFVAGPRA